MRKVLLSAVSIASLGLVVSVAQAADVVPEPVPTWTGFHIGAGGGAGYNLYDAESAFSIFGRQGSALTRGIDPDAAFGQAITADDLGAWYGFGTIEAGFDFQFPDSAFVIGILANYDFNGDTSASAEAGHVESDDNFTDSKIEAETDDAWFLGGRLGFVIHEDTLLYGLGGYTWIKGKVKSEHSFDDDGFPFQGETEVDEKDNVDGWTLGAGLEHLITENFSLKIEYRHDFLGDIDFDESGNLEEPSPAVPFEHSGSVDFSRDTVRAVLSWRFNPGW